MPPENAVEAPAAGEVLENPPSVVGDQVEGIEEAAPVGEEGAEVAAEGAEGAEPGAENQPAEPDYVAALRTELDDLKTWRADQEKIRAQQQHEEKPASTQPPTDQEWANLEKNFGFSTVENKDQTTGETRKSLNINPRSLIQAVSNMVEYAMKQQNQRFETRLHESTAESLVERTISSLERRPTKPLSDIRQFSTAMTEYYKKFHAPTDWSKPEVVETAYWYAKGRGIKDAVKRAVNGKEQNKAVIHPTAARPSAKAPTGVITSLERSMMAGMTGPKGMPITDKEWLAAKGRG